MIESLTSLYPLKKSPATEWLFMLGTGVFVAFFLIVFQPFGTREFQSETKYVFLAGYGAVISATLFLTNRLLPVWLPRLFDEEIWTVGKHILFLLLAFSLVFFACYLYKGWYFGQGFSLAGFVGFYPVALSVAVFPIAGLVVGDYVVRLRRFTKGAAEVNTHFTKKEKSAPSAALILPDENGKPVQEVALSQLLFLKASDNYVEVHFIENGKAARSLIRNTLSAMEAVLAGTPVVRCHRSYLVHPGHVTGVAGNAQGYRLQFAVPELSVPVARGRVAEVLEILQ